MGSNARTPKSSTEDNSKSANDNLKASLQASKQIIQDNVKSILKDIKDEILPRYNLDSMNIAEISFGEEVDCPDGYELICKNFGNDPRTGRPIVRCKCVKRRF